MYTHAHTHVYIYTYIKIFCGFLMNLRLETSPGWPFEWRLFLFEKMGKVSPLLESEIFTELIAPETRIPPNKLTCNLSKAMS